VVPQAINVAQVVPANVVAPAPVVANVAPLPVVVFTPGPAPVGSPQPDEPAGPPPFNPEDVNNLVETFVYYTERPSLMCVVVMAFMLVILTLVIVSEGQYKTAGRFLIFVLALVGWDCLAFASLLYNFMFSANVWKILKEMNRFGIEDIDCTIYNGSGSNPAQGRYAMSIYGRYDSMGVEISVISTGYTHYKRVRIYRDVYEFLWTLRAGSSDNTLLMSWMLGEASRKYKIDNGYQRLRMEYTVHVAYQCIVSARLKERKAQHPGSTSVFNRVAF